MCTYAGVREKGKRDLKKRERWEDLKAASKFVDLYPTISIITLILNGQSISVKRQRLSV